MFFLFWRDVNGRGGRNAQKTRRVCLFVWFKLCHKMLLNDPVCSLTHTHIERKSVRVVFNHLLVGLDVNVIAPVLCAETGRRGSATSKNSA